MRKLLVVGVVWLVSVGTAVAADNVVVNGGFEEKLGRNFWGSPFGGGPGSVGRVQERPHAGAWCVQVRKDRGPGGAQLMGELPLGDLVTFEYSFWYRGAGTAAFSLAHLENGKVVPTKDGAGKPFCIRRSLPAAKDWTHWSYRMTLPPSYRLEGTVLRPQFQVWGGNVPSTLWLDDIEIRPAEVEKASAPPPVNVTVRMPKKTRAYAPIDVRDAVKVSYDGGLMRRDGKPYFWVGNGCDLGSAQATPIGLWLAKVQGVSFVALEGGHVLGLGETGPTNAVVTSGSCPQQYSWFREANRLGFLAEAPLTAGTFKWSPLKKYSEAHPDFAEAYYHRGHGLSADTRTKLGREIALASRLAFTQNANDDGNFILELGREPGPEPSNARCLRDFRAWCARKYGTLEKACAVWRRHFASWDEVTPIHLDKTELAAGVSMLSLRKFAKAEHPEFAWDWLAYLQEDTEISTRNEIDDLRAAGVRTPIALDVRGHRHYNDCYLGYEPEAIDRMLDVFFVHYGNHPYVYNDSPWHEKTLLDQTTFPLFMYSYFRTNVKHPIVNCEDIVSSAGLPGSNAEAMARNDLGQLHQTPWKFTIDERDEGLAAKWFVPGFDDAGWGEVRVPGAWDDQDAFRGKSGIGWYRKTFVSKANRNDWRDGSRRFYLYGKGVAQRGTVWLNGKKVGDVDGWSKPYRFEVSELLNYGGQPNTLAFRVDGRGFQNGLRFYCHLLAQDMISEARPFGEDQYRSMLWTYLMRGSSGVLVWHWFKEAPRLYMPALVKPLEVAAEVVQEDLRFRRSDVAYLYAYLGGRGLPCPSDETHEPEVAWYDALEFLGKRPDLVSESTFRREVTPASHRVVVAPYQRFVEEETWRHFKDYVEAGGTGVVTTGSFERTFAAWKPTGFAAWAATRGADGRLGKGRLVVAPDGFGVRQAMELLRPLVPAPDVALAPIGEPKEELPLIERCLAGSATRKVVYLHNWGGQDHRFAVTLPSDCRGWKVTPLVGAWGTADGLSVCVRSQQPAAALLEAPGAEKAVALQVNARHQEILDRLAALYADRDTGKPKVLWPDFPKPYYTPNGREIYPYLLDRIEAFGCEHAVRPLESWTDEELAKYRLVILPEGNSHVWRNVSNDKAFAARLRRYVENGGSLLFLAMTARTVNAGAAIYRKMAGAFGVGLEWDRAEDSAHAAFGDPCQVETDALEPGVLTEGVKGVSFFVASPLKIAKDSPAKPVVKVPDGAKAQAGRALMAAATVGKGRVFFSADAMVFQPFRIEHADNAALLENVMGWLLDRPVTQAMREDFKANLFLTERDLPSLDVKAE